MKKSYKLKKGIKTALIVCGVYAVIIAYLLLCAARFDALDENSYTEDGRSKAWTIEIIKEK